MPSKSEAMRVMVPDPSGTPLKWVGRPGLAFVPGWPAADHEEVDPDLAALKLASGLYETDTPEPKAKAPKTEVDNGN